MRLLFTRNAVTASLLLCAAIPCHAQGEEQRFIPGGTEIPLVTAEPLSSKRNVKGDMVSLTTASDVVIDGKILIPKGTPAKGQITEARAKGAMGMSGKLAIRPLYIRLGDTFIRMGGATSDKGSVTAGAVAGMVLITPGFTGRSAEIPAGSPLTGHVDKGVTLDP